MTYRNLYHLRGYYYFRIKVPHDLQSYFERKEIKKSLGTKDLRDATFRVAVLRRKTISLFNLLRNQMLTKEQIQKLVHTYFTETLEELEQDRAEGRNLPKTPEELDSCVWAYQDRIGEDRQALAFGEHKGVADIVDDFIASHNVDIEQGSPDYLRLSREIHKALIKVMKIEVQSIQGNYNNEDDRWFQTHDHPNAGDDAAGKAILLPDLIKDYVEECVLRKRWDEKTQAENQSILNVFLEIVGEVDVSSITRQKMTEVFQSIQRLPANRNKRVAYRGKSIRELLEMDIPAPMSTITVNKYMNRISSLFKWAVQQGFMDRNPAVGLSVKQMKKASEYREVYTNEELKKLEESVQGFQEDNPERYWIPLIAMYSGMRLNEICQLYLEDLRKVDGIPCFHINGKGDRKLKNPSADRMVPVHPALQDLGFLECIEKIRKQEAERLWPNLKKGRDGYGQAFSKWFQRHNDKHITDNPKKVFHSLRHTVINSLKQQGVPETIIGEIVGHAHESITTGRYGKEYRPKVLLEALKKLDYGIITLGP